MRKRGVKLVEDPAVAASALVLDVDDMEEALLVPDSDMIGRDLVPHLIMFATPWWMITFAF
jgi:hypothetical protein